MELIGTPVLILAFLLMSSLTNDVEVSGGPPKEFVFGFVFFLFCIYLFLFIKAYRPQKKRYRQETITRQYGETPAQKRRRLDKLSEWQAKLKNVRAGIEAEDRTAATLASILDDNWILYRNVTLPDGRKDDIDAVLAGPTGVFSLEIKAYSGYHRYSGDTWETSMGGGAWKKEQWSPAVQATQGVQRLTNFLAQRGLRIAVEPRVVWAGTGRVEIIGRPPVSIWFLTSQNSSDWIRRDLLDRHSILSRQHLFMIE